MWKNQFHNFSSSPKKRKKVNNFLNLFRIIIHLTTQQEQKNKRNEKNTHTHVNLPKNKENKKIKIKKISFDKRINDDEDQTKNKEDIKK